LRHIQLLHNQNGPFWKQILKRNLRNGQIDIVIGKNYSFKRDNSKHAIPLTGKFNKEANDCGLVH